MGDVLGKRIGLVAFLVLAGCSDPLSDVPRLSDAQLDGPEPVAEVAAAPEETGDGAGFFQRLLRKREVGAAEGDTRQADGSPAMATGQDTASPQAKPEDAETEAQAPARGGFLRRLFGSDKADTVTEGSEAQSERVVIAALGRDSGAAGPAAPKQGPRGGQGGAGLFSARKAAHLTGPDAREAAPGEVLPFGHVARACHVKRRDLGMEVGQYPERRPKYHLHDSDPGDPGLNSFYITGFGDGCPRQVTAALAVFGSPSMYEALRYGVPESARTGRETDRAYERIKSRVCSVSRNKPCGSRIDRMDRGTVFVSLYNRFEGADGWINILIHDGEMLAMAPGG